jgi:hypothetical protein
METPANWPAFLLERFPAPVDVPTLSGPHQESASPRRPFGRRGEGG